MQTLKNQMTSKQIGRAYLLCGTRGTGRTSIARILARAVNCEHPVDGSPYNECPACRFTQSGSPMNMVEIDAASNNGVGNTRDIRERVQYPPTEGRCRVYIIDEVHMLSIGAFNALLKTLEGPPSYMIFILATTEVHKILTTILSRCQRYDFKRISLETIASHLRELIRAEQIQMEDKAPLYVVKVVDGPLRNALSLLDQCVAFHYGKMPAYDSVLEVLGAVDSGVFGQIFDVIVEGRTRDCICGLEETVIRGRELGQFVIDFVWYIGNLLLIQSADDAEGLVDMSKENLKQLRNDAGKTDEITLVRYIRIFSELSNQLRYASQKRVLMEVAFIKLMRPSMGSNLDATLQRLGGLGAQMEDLEARHIAVPMVAVYQEAGSAPAGQVPRTGARPEVGGGTVPQAAAPYAPGLQADPGAAPKRAALPQAQLEDLKLARNEQARIVHNMGGGARSYLRDTVMEPGGGGCLTIVLMDPMNCDMGKRPIMIEGLKCYVEANFGRPIHFKARLVGRGERLNTIYVTQGESEEEIHMNITYEDE